MSMHYTNPILYGDYSDRTGNVTGNVTDHETDQVKRLVKAVRGVAKTREEIMTMLISGTIKLLKINDMCNLFIDYFKSNNTFLFRQRVSFTNLSCFHIGDMFHTHLCAVNV